MDRQNRALSVRKGQSPFPRPSAPPASSAPRAPPTPPQDYSDDENATVRGQYRNNFNKSSSRYTSGRQEPVASAFPSYYFSNDGASTKTTKSRSQQQQQQQRPPTPPKDAPQTRTSPRMPQGPFQGTRRRQPSEPQPQSRPRAGSQRQQQQYYSSDADYQNTSSSRVRDYSNVSINIGTGGFGFGGSGGPSITVNGRDWRDEGGRSRYRDERANGDRYWDDDRDDGRPRINHIHTPFISTPFGFGGDRPRAGFLNLGGFGIF